jgi:excisionase family DNA binding protein
MTSHSDMSAAGLRVLDLLNAAEVAQRLRDSTGKRCSVKKVTRLAAEGELEQVRFGALVRITPESVTAYEQRQAAS